MHISFSVIFHSYLLISNLICLLWEACGSDYPCINYKGPVKAWNFSLASVAHQKQCDFNEHFGILIFPNYR